MGVIEAIRKAVDDAYDSGKHLPIVEAYQLFVQKLSENGYEIVEKDSEKIKK